MTASKPTKLPDSARTVVVACKIPTGLRLQLEKPDKRIVSGKNGDEAVTFNVPDPTSPVYVVAGPAYPIMPPKGYPKPPLIVGGYAMTGDIPVEFWRKWEEQKKLFPPLMKGEIFAAESLQEASARALENEKLLTGLEPISTDINPKTGTLTDPRIPRPVGLGVGKLSPDDRRAA